MKNRTRAHCRLIRRSSSLNQPPPMGSSQHNRAPWSSQSAPSNWQPLNERLPTNQIGSHSLDFGVPSAEIRLKIKRRSTIFCRRRANARRTPLAKIRPGRPAPTMGAGISWTARFEFRTVAANISELFGPFDKPPLRRCRSSSVADVSLKRRGA
jgi:hypothetical protein